VAEIIFHPEADDEYEQAWAWYYERSPRAARRFDAEMARKFELVLLNPESFPAYDNDYRFFRNAALFLYDRLSSSRRCDSRIGCCSGGPRAGLLETATLALAAWTRCLSLARIFIDSPPISD
jgi:plasmid stabilization system protein ParE